MNERIRELDGVKVRTKNNEIGTIYLTYINRETEKVQIWVNIESKNGDYSCSLRPWEITEIISGSPKQINNYKMIVNTST
jgi:hypothetical protein